MTSERKFKTGDTVRLNSGGPKMTVGGYDTLGRTICAWLDAKGEPRTDTFDEDMLKTVPTAAQAAPSGVRYAVTSKGV